MKPYAALLRAVNLGSHNKIAMHDLRGLAETLGMRDAKTLLQSGNLVFRAAAASVTSLETALEAGARTHLGLATEFMVRTPQDVRAVIKDNPFPEQAATDPSHLVVLFTRKAVATAAVTELQRAITGREVVKAKGSHVYIVYPDGIGDSRLTGAVLDRKLGTSGTGRNWNTVLKLNALLEAMGD